MQTWSKKGGGGEGVEGRKEILQGSKVYSVLHFSSAIV